LKSKEELERKQAWGSWLGGKLKLGIGLLKPRGKGDSLFITN